jgi:hypothetical protein
VLTEEGRVVVRVHVGIDAAEAPLDVGVIGVVMRARVLS